MTPFQPATRRRSGPDRAAASAPPPQARRRALVVALALVPLLAACHPHPQAKSDDQRTAEGRILPHSISDAMLPYDTASSQPPLAPRVDHAAAAAADDAASDAATAADSSTPAPAPTD